MDIFRQLVRERRVRLLAAGVVLTVAIAGIGVAASASGDGVTGPPNTAGIGGHARSAAGPPLALATLSPTARSVLAAANAAGVRRSGSIGTGDHIAELLTTTLANGAQCATVTHAAGAIVEPLNCRSDAYLRVWTDSTGTGAVGEAPSSTRLIALVANEVQSVQVALSDGSTRTLTPTASGVVVLEMQRSVVPAHIDALDGGGTLLASVGT